MEDSEVIEAFVALGARQAFGPSLHIEGDALMLQGWWHTAFRVSHDVFLVRDEEPPQPTPLRDDLMAAMAGQGLKAVAVDLPAITAITYAELSLGGLSWAVWAEDLAAGEEGLAARAGAQSFFGEPVSDATAHEDGYADLAGARRAAGLPPTVILTVGVDVARVEELMTGLPDCQFVAKGLDEIAPDACSTLLPTLILVDATGQAGREFAMELRASACGRFLPVVALSYGPDVPLGADAAVDPAEPPARWTEPIRALLP